MNATLPPCRWRKAHSEGKIACASTKFIFSVPMVGESLCLRCPFVDHEPAAAARVGPRPAAVPLPVCVHLGASVHPPAAPDNVKDWRQCDHTPSHGVVCRCQGCGPQCPDYEPEK